MTQARYKCIYLRPAKGGYTYRICNLQTDECTSGYSTLNRQELKAFIKKTLKRLNALPKDGFSLAKHLRKNHVNR